jgi:hypothetical protein
LSGRRRSQTFTIGALGLVLIGWFFKARIDARTELSPDSRAPRDRRQMQAWRPPRFLPSSDAHPPIRAPASSTVPMAPATASSSNRPAQSGPQGVTYAASLAAVRESVKAIGGDLFRTLLLEDRGFYLSYAGGIRDCADGFIKQSAEFVNWIPTGSLAFDVEVRENRLRVIRAVPLRDKERHTQRDDAF